MKIFLMIGALGMSCCLFFQACSTREQEELPPRPNILFAIADDASFQHMSAYGCDWVQTPAFDRVAREGILFLQAYTPNAKCAPSRANILTGRKSWQLEEAANHDADFPAKFTTFVEALSANGYFTGHTAKGWAPGNPGEVDGKPRQLTGKPFNNFKIKAPTSDISGNDYAANFEDFLEHRSEGEPFFFWYGSSEPHRAYEYGSGIEKGSKKLEDIDQVPAFWPDNDSVRTDMLDYALEIEYFDSHLLKMLQALEERGELENTIVVVTSDNGMPFPRVKGQAYEYSNHMPLAIMWKGGLKNSGRHIDDFISFIDFSPTFLELARISTEEDGMEPMTGKSFTDILYSDSSGVVDASRDAVVIGKERHDVGRPHDWGYPIRGIVTEEFLYLHNFETSRWPSGNPEAGYLNTDGSPTKTVILNGRKEEQQKHYWVNSFGKRDQEELYQISKDPECINNLALLPEYLAVQLALKERLFNKLEEENDPRMFGKGHVFDEYEYSRPQFRNFYERYMGGEEINTGWVNDSDYEKNFLDTELKHN